MEVQLPYIKEQTAKTIVLAVFQFLLNFINLVFNLSYIFGKFLKLS